MKLPTTKPIPIEWAEFKRITGNRWLWNVVRVASVGGLLFYLYRTGQLKFNKLDMALERIDLALAATLLICLGALVAVQRWRVLLRVQNISLGIWLAIKLTLVGFFFGVALPGAVSGDIVKAYYLVRGEKQKVVLITSILVDRFLGLYTLMFTATVAVIISFLNSIIKKQVGVWEQPSMIILGNSICLLFLFFTLIGLLCMSQRSRNSNLVKYMLVRMPFHKIFSSVYDVIQQYRQKPRLTFNSFLLSLVAQFITYAGMFCIAMLLKMAAVTSVHYLIALPVGALVNSIPLTPAGLGVGEVGFREIFLLFGSQEGAELAVIFHAIFLILALGIGGAVYLFSDLSTRIRT